MLLGSTCIGSRRIVTFPAASDVDTADNVDGGGGGGRAVGGAGARYFLTAGAGDTRLTDDDEVGGSGARYFTGLGGSAGFCSCVICDVIISSHRSRITVASVVQTEYTVLMSSLQPCDRTYITQNRQHGLLA